MTYKLTADIGDMSRAEAAALIRAIIEIHGTSLVDGVMDEGSSVASRPSLVSTRVGDWEVPYVGGGGGGGTRGETPPSPPPSDVKG